MNHAITIGGLLGTFGIIGGGGCVLVGLLMLAGASMSDTGDASARPGCTTIIIGIALLALSAWAIFA